MTEGHVLKYNNFHDRIKMYSDLQRKTKSNKKSQIEEMIKIKIFPAIFDLVKFEGFEWLKIDFFEFFSLGAVRDTFSQK